MINTSSVPILSINPDAESDFGYPLTDLLVPTDDSRGARLALAEGIAVGRCPDATLHVLNVVETSALGPDVRSAVKRQEGTDAASNLLDDAVERAAAASLERVEPALALGSPAREIRSYVVERGIDLTLMGTHVRTDVSRYAFGGVSSNTVRTSPVPVVWLREDE